MKWNTILLLAVWVGVFSSCKAQNKAQRSAIAIGDTVSEIGNTIYYIFQDKKNIHWFGSSGQGVYRYDGKTMTRFSTQHGLCNNYISGICEDKAGNIYFNTLTGVSKYDGQVFTTLQSVSSPNGGWRLHPDDLWFRGAQDSGVVYRYDGNTLHRLTFPKTKAGEDFIAKYPRAQYPQMTFSPYDVYSIYKDRRGNLWFGTNMGVCRYDGKNFDWIPEDVLGIDDISFHVRSTYEDKKGKFWFTNTMHRFIIYDGDTKANGKGPMTFKKEKGIVSSKNHDVAYFMSSTEDNKGDLWMVTYNKGVWRYDGKSLVQYPVKDGNENITLFSVYKDNNGELWLGTHTAGVYKLNGSTFEKFKL